MMGCVYFSIPVIAGYGLSSWIVLQSEATVEERLAGNDSSGGKCAECNETNGTWKMGVFLMLIVRSSLFTLGIFYSE